ncbi:UNVERIFIED_CONTAM: hypothetical protein GTU68_003688 [Idotea baltica]|nr:hypothetical protein [Idotea baltica]
MYLDYAATTPVDDQVLEFMLPYFNEHYGNAASRFHAYGWEAEELVENARKGIAQNLGCAANDLIFTSGATESINLALKGVFSDFSGHMITVQTEHKATLDTAEHLESKGVEVTYLVVDKNGQIGLEELEKAIRPKTKLVSVLHVNNETGVIADIDAIAEICQSKGILVHVDASQSLGKLPFPKGADLVSFSAHKIYGPKGVGVLVAKPNVDVSSQIHGGKQQHGEDLLMRLHKIAVSNGSACNTASTEPSYVLKAMGLSDAAAYSSIRFSFGRFTTEEEMVMAAEHVIEIVKELCS